MTSDYLIEARQLCKQVRSGEQRLTLLRDVDLGVRRGEVVAIVGASGSGKSTLLGLLAGLDVATRGELRLLGESLGGLDEDERARLRAGRVGFVFQSFQLLAGLTALENVMVPLELLSSNDARRDDPEALAREALAEVGLSERLRHFPNQLSGGEQQRVALARAFVARPAVLFADEPTGNLDSHTGAQVIDLLFDLQREQGATLVLVTHDEQLAGRCDRRYLLTDGHLSGEAGR